MVDELKTRTVAVIGAGASGLATAKCLREDNHQPVIFEKSDRLGGLWAYRPERGGTFSTVHFQHSKYVSAFSDYPMPEDCSEFPHHSEVLKYLHDYADNFGLRDCIQFRSAVENVTKKGEGWEVTINKEGTKSTAYFDAIAVCSGIYNEPRLPNFPGAEKFQGTILHGIDYKEPSIFTGKKVIIVGNGPTGVDIAVAASYNAKKVVWSFRQKRWILPRYAGKLPIDFIVTRLNKHIPFRHHLLSLVNIRKFYPIILAHKWAKLKPESSVERCSPLFNEDALNRMRIKALETKPNIERIEEDRVVFDDGTCAEADIIIYATGYRLKVPFLNSYLGEDHQKNLELYKMVFHPEIPNCAFMGFINGNVIFPCSELQARWFSKLLAGEASLPPKAEMWEAIKAYQKRQEEDWTPTPYRSLKVSAFEYMDDIASEIHAVPQVRKHLPIMWHLLAGPMISTQYRLDGPNQWEGAEDWIEKVVERTRK